MKFNIKILILVPFLFLLVGCPKDDAPESIQVRSYADVAAKDEAELIKFMGEHFITTDADYNVTFTKITTSTSGTSILNGLDNTLNQNDISKPLKYKIIEVGGVNHKLYYLKLREGVGENPTKIDSVFTAYKGFKTDLSSFDSKTNPFWFPLDNVITGWSELFPIFKTGNAVFDVNTGITTFSDFGAGVMFVPSGLAYFNSAQKGIGSYTPLIFSFKIMKQKSRDHDGDKLLSKDEYLGTGLVSGKPIDSDGDGKLDYADFDDDNDGLLTKNEVKKASPLIGWYDYYAPELNCTFGNGKKKHLNPNTACN